MAVAGAARVGLTVAATLLVLAIGALVFVGSGLYNIGADDHHTRIVLAIIEQLRQRSIATRTREIWRTRTRLRPAPDTMRRSAPAAIWRPD
jgi:hypothetical protein